MPKTTRRLAACSTDAKSTLKPTHFPSKMLLLRISNPKLKGAREQFERLRWKTVPRRKMTALGLQMEERRARFQECVYTRAGHEGCRRAVYCLCEPRVNKPGVKPACSSGGLYSEVLKGRSGLERTQHSPNRILMISG